jgi:hypothetical protein
MSEIEKCNWSEPEIFKISNFMRFAAMSLLTGQLADPACNDVGFTGHF